MITFKNVRIIDPESNRDSLGSLTIDNGIIEKIDGPVKGESIDCKGACLAPGIVDIGPKICEPGERHKESFRTCLLYTSPSPRDRQKSRMPSSA